MYVSEWRKFSNCPLLASNQKNTVYFGSIIQKTKFFSVGYIDSNHSTLPTVLFPRPLPIPTYLSVTVFLGFHFFVLNPPL